MKYKYIIIICLMVAHQAFATTYSSDGSSQNVQTLINSAANGDTITVPNGTFTWTTQVVFNKTIILKGVGSGVSLQHQHGRVYTWQSPPAGFSFVEPCPSPLPILLTTDSSIKPRSTAIINNTGNTLIKNQSFPNSSPSLIGMRFIGQAGVLTVDIGSVIFQDCWFQ